MLNKPFVYVNDADIEAFKTKYINTEETKYNNSIVFLGSSGKIATQGKYYGGELDNNTIVALLKEKMSFEVDDDYNLVAKLDGTIISTVELPMDASSIPCKSITVEDTTVNIAKDGTKQLVTTITPQNTTDTVFYYTSNQDIATVSDEGLITWKSGGEVTITINCGRKELQVTVNCDKLLNTTYTIEDKVQNRSIFGCDEDKLYLSYEEVTTEKWSVRGDVRSTTATNETIEIGYNLTNAPIVISGNTEWEDNLISYSGTQYQYTVLPYKFEFSCIVNADKTDVRFIKKSESETSNRRAIGKLADSSSDTNFLTNIKGLLNITYDLMYIPAKVKTLILTWNSQNNTIYFAPNIFNRLGERVYDAGWTHNEGTITVDLSSYDEGLWYAGNIKTSPDSSSAMQAITFENLNPMYQVETYTLWDKYLNWSPVSKSNEKMIQGADVFNGYLYQFYDGTGGIMKYNLNDLTEAPVNISTPDENLHYGSIKFSNIYQYGSTTITTPLVFCTGHYIVNGLKHEIIDVIDLDNNILVKQYIFEDRKDDIIAAYDFTNSKCWLIGYEPIAGYATGNWYIDEYTLTDLSSPTDVTYTQTDAYFIGNTHNNTLQDCKYKDGYIYILTGWGQQNQKGTIWKFDCATKNIIGKTESTSTKEFEGLSCLDDYMIATNTQESYKVKYKFDCVTNTVMNQLSVASQDILELKNAGCLAVEDVYDEYPNILQMISGSDGMYFGDNNITGAGGAYINTLLVPDNTDTIGSKFMLLDNATNARTLWCTRTSSTTDNFTAFVISMQLRADFGNKSYANQYTLTTNKLYDYSQDGTTGILSLNGVEKTVAVPEFTPGAYITIGQSHTGTPITSLSNQFNHAIISTFWVKNSSGAYKMYLVPISDTQFIDLVTGNKFTMRGSDNYCLYSNLNLT